MTQNLRITGDSIKAKDPNNTTGTITSADSNVSSNYNIPASSSPWQTSGTATSELNKQLVHYAGNENNGANYTWGTATAGTLGSSYSICPRGWKLPTKAQYDTLTSKDGGWDDSKKGRTLSGGFFPAAGGVYNGSLNDVGSAGYYWSSTGSGSLNAYYLYFYSSNVYTSNNNRYHGYSVRCIAP